MIRTDDINVGVDQDDAVLVVGFTLVHSRVTELHFSQDESPFGDLTPGLVKV